MLYFYIYRGLSFSFSRIVSLFIILHEITNMSKLAQKVEDMAIAFIYAVVLIGSVGFAFWSQVNTAALDTTQLLAWGLILTFLVLGVAFGFIGYMRRGGGR